MIYVYGRNLRALSRSVTKRPADGKSEGGRETIIMDNVK